MKLGSFIKIIDSGWADEASVFSLGIILDLLKKKSKINIALSGGSTPLPVFEKWIKAGLHAEDWKKINFFWVDERCVNIDDPMSNFGNAWHILKELPCKFNRMFDGSKSPSQAAGDYERLLIKQLPLDEGIPVFDLILLGVGEDGHIASLFPGSNGLNTTDRFVITNKIENKSSVRITITFPVLWKAAHLLFLINDKIKLPIINEIVTGNPSYPLANALKGNNLKTWIYKV